MPRKQRKFEEPRRPTSGGLVDRLADELREKRESGQPVIDEKFSSGKIRVVVIWDNWENVSLEDRTGAILQAYENVEGRDFSNRIALASGLTVPEAYGAGMLPFEVIAILRKNDTVTSDDCAKALLEEGASKLFGGDRPQLRFATLEDAEAARRRLAKRLPESDQVWAVLQEPGRIEDWSQA